MIVIVTVTVSATVNAPANETEIGIGTETETVIGVIGVIVGTGGIATADVMIATRGNDTTTATVTMILAPNGDIKHVMRFSTRFVGGFLRLPGSSFHPVISEGKVDGTHLR